MNVSAPLLVHTTAAHMPFSSFSILQTNSLSKMQQTTGTLRLETHAPQRRKYCLLATNETLKTAGRYLLRMCKPLSKNTKKFSISKLVQRLHNTSKTPSIRSPPCWLTLITRPLPQKILNKEKVKNLLPASRHRKVRKQQNYTSLRDHVTNTAADRSVY